MHFPYASSALVGVILLGIVYRFAKRFSRLPLPPGPPGLPIIGNMLHMPTYRSWATFTEWAHKYGSVVYLSVLGRSIVVLNSRTAITDLLEKRSAIYSDRPTMTMAGEMIGLNKYIVLERYGNRHKEGRKLLVGTINQRKAAVFQRVQESKVMDVLPRMLNTPQDFGLHIRWLVASIVFQTTHGHHVEHFDDKVVQIAEQASLNFALAVKPGAFVVDSLPFLQYLPYWFPGAGFKAQADKMRADLRALYDVPWALVKEQMARGTAFPSFAVALLERNIQPTPEEEDLYKTSSAVFYSAGAETTVSALESFFLMMIKYPEIQRKAQAELDSILESGSLPKFSDRPKLPYIDAVIKEVHRWNPVLPLALPHKLTQDDIYDGFHIPAGSTVIPNTWAVLHDPSVYPDPFNAIPERYLHTEGGVNPDPRSFVFGYGRRTCPGQIFADDSLFIIMSTLLTTFDISRPKGPDGRLIEPEIKYSGNSISHPEPFECRITPRSADISRLIESISTS